MQCTFGEHLLGVSFCQGKLFVGGKFRHQAKISSFYVDEFFFEGKILKIEICLCLRFCGKIICQGKFFVRENYSWGKISSGILTARENIRHQAKNLCLTPRTQKLKNVCAMSLLVMVGWGMEWGDILFKGNLLVIFK